MTTETLRFTLLAALSLALICLASDPQSGPDQYAAARQHDHSHPHRSLSEALKALKSQHRFDLPPKKPVIKEDNVFDNNIVPDLQVGCGDGLFLETTTTPRPAIPKHKRVFPRKDRRKREANPRKPRSYFAYTVHTPASISYSVWSPHIYRLQRPYYIPIFGTRGRLPIYFPPQAVYVNPGFPIDNPPQIPSREYLPPSTTTTESTPSTERTNLSDRFGAPVWGSRPASEASTTTSSPTPTRRPSRPSTSTFPPLIHRPDPNLPAQRPTATTTTTTAIPPPLANEALPTPQALESNPPPAAAMNQCIWAIINCCSAGSKDVSESCFERLGCPGPFWGRSPCESHIARQAIASALDYYQTK